LSVNQFNQGVYDIIIASDERSLDEPHAVKHVGKKGYIYFYYHLFTGSDFTLDRYSWTNGPVSVVSMQKVQD